VLATSAAGWVRVALVGQDRQLHSVELLGDSLDRTVVFKDGQVSALSSQRL
jgi:hypothetical protein